MSKQKKLLKSFLAKDGGQVAITFALCALPVFGIVGLAIDYGGAYSTRSRLQNVLDASALAGARLDNASDDDRIGQAQTSFTANAASDPRLANLVPTITVSGETVVVSAATTYPTSVMGLMGVSNLEVAATSTANNSVTMGSVQLEVAMMIDLTGSMGESRSGQTKIASLKDAATDFLSILFPNGTTSSANVRIGIAPFADYVNAGPYAAAATGLAATGGAYSNITNLASTRQGSFSGHYSGVTMNASGSQCGATSPTGIVSASGATAPVSVNGAGATYSNAYCANPTVTTTVTTPGTTTVSAVPLQTYSYQSRNCNNGNCTTTNKTASYGFYVPVSGGSTPASLITASSTQPIVSSWGLGSNGDIGIYSFDGDNNPPAVYTQTYAFAPVPVNETGITRISYTGSVQAACTNQRVNNHTTCVYPPPVNMTGDVGLAIASYDSTPPAPFVRVSSTASGGFWAVTRYSNGSWNYTWTTSGYYLPLYNSLTTTVTGASTTSTVTSTVPGCESATMSTPASQLISCVTERQGSHAYDDASPSTAAVGSYAHGGTASNYSSDGKCYVAGRELPSIIPMTNQKQPLTDFFTNAKIGGATPGHIGTAWAWYMLSPNWASVFPAASTPAAYNTPNVQKVAVLMTDGEYNVHYASADSKTQALALCTAMKAQGILVYSVGFGFSNSSTAGDGSIDGAAKDILQKCSSGSNYYFFPYDGTALRAAFSNIGNQLNAVLTTGVVRVTQ